MKILQNKINLLCITVCIITGGIFSFYSFEENYKYLIESRINSSKNDMTIFSENIQAKINELKGKSSGMDGYLAKPISVKALEEVLLTVSQ